MMVREWEGDRPKRVDRLSVHRLDGIMLLLLFFCPFRSARPGRRSVQGPSLPGSAKRCDQCAVFILFFFYFKTEI